MLEQHGRHRAQRARWVILLWVGIGITAVSAVVILVAGHPTDSPVPPVPLKQELTSFPPPPAVGPPIVPETTTTTTTSRTRSRTRSSTTTTTTDEG